MDEHDERDLDTEELEVTCPLNGHEATIQVRTDENPFENAVVVYCPNFGDEAITCGQPCLHYEGGGRD
jgi:C4-type Zn-finger protein